MKTTILLILIITMIFTRSNGQQVNPVFEYLFDSSSLVVQGVVIAKDCHFDELDVLDCEYSILIDSIYKGEIFGSELQLLKPGEQDSTDRRIITFQKNCLLYLESAGSAESKKHFKDICYEKNDNIIVFLKRNQLIDPQTKEERQYLKLTDSWLGIQLANSYMALTLRQFVKFEYLRHKK